VTCVVRSEEVRNIFLELEPYEFALIHVGPNKREHSGVRACHATGNNNLNNIKICNIDN